MKHGARGRLSYRPPLTIWLLLGYATLAAGCNHEEGIVGDDDETVAVSPTPARVPVPGDYSLTGTVSYEYVPYDEVNEGLNYGATTPRPIRGCEIYLKDADTEETLATTISGEDGSYEFEWSGSNYVKLWTYARTVDPVIRVEDNTHEDAIWVVQSEIVDARDNTPYHYLATTGWSGDSYRGQRASAPFAVLDAAYTAARRFMEETSDPPEFPPLAINWSPGNRPECCDKSQGEISSSHWDGSEIYLVGKEDLDTDEFDSHVIVHEWGHYFEDKLSRSDSLGGVHMLGDVLDPRLAWGEGWGNGLSAIILDDPVFGMSYGNNQAYGMHLEVDQNPVSLEDAPGWYSETSVMALLYDLYDTGDDEPFDQVALGIDPLYQVLVGPQADTSAYTTLFSFIAFLKQLYPEEAEGIDQLVTYHSTNPSFGIDVVQDEWGNGETHDGGVDGALPIYQEAEVGDTLQLQLTGNLEYNKLGQNRYVKLTGDGSIIRVTTTCDQELDVYVQHKGEYIAGSYRSGGNERTDFRSEAGEIYVVNVIGLSEAPIVYEVTVEITVVEE